MLYLRLTGAGAGFLAIHHCRTLCLAPLTRVRCGRSGRRSASSSPALLMSRPKETGRLSATSRHEDERRLKNVRVSFLPQKEDHSPSGPSTPSWLHAGLTAARLARFSFRRT